MSKSFYLSLALLAFMLLACVGLQNAPTSISESPSGTRRPSSTPLATLDDEAIRQTQSAIVEIATYIAPYYPLTETSAAATATSISATAEASGVDPFALTATSIIATATAYAVYTPSGVSLAQHPYVHRWPVIHFEYELIGENRFQRPEISEREGWNFSCSVYRVCVASISHEITIHSNAEMSETALVQILEDAIKRLSDYPPFNPAVYETVLVQQFDIPHVNYGQFSYSEALAAYDSGLRGAALAEALGVGSIEE